ncbi:MAG TPA: ATP-binding protein, partial [Nitrospira sp.]|nr:ATP-binding protein [Nitrospira sp.]
TDTGIGIPEQDRPRVFERFYRVDKARSRELGGTGLGLAIVRHIVEGHGGQIWVEGNVPTGSRFVVRLPA